MSEVENTRTVNPNATSGAGRGYDPVRLGARAIAEPTRYNDTVVKITPRVDPVVGGGGGTAGAFFTMRTVASGDATNGDIYLQGGNVGGGAGNAIVPEFLVYDASDGASPWAGTAGQHLELDITGDGSATSGILDPVFNVTAAAASVQATVGANTLPTAASPSGKHCKLSLGTFTDAGFSPALPGNISLSFCWGGYSINRV